MHKKIQHFFWQHSNIKRRKNFLVRHYLFTRKLLLHLYTGFKRGLKNAINFRLAVISFSRSCEWYIFRPYSFNIFLIFFNVLSTPTVYFWKFEKQIFADLTFLMATWWPRPSSKKLPPWIFFFIKIIPESHFNQKIASNKTLHTRDIAPHTINCWINIFGKSAIVSEIYLLI